MCLQTTCRVHKNVSIDVLFVNQEADPFDQAERLPRPGSCQDQYGTRGGANRLELSDRWVHLQRDGHPATVRIHPAQTWANSTMTSAEVRPVRFGTAKA